MRNRQTDRQALKQRQTGKHLNGDRQGDTQTETDRETLKQRQTGRHLNRDRQGGT